MNTLPISLPLAVLAFGSAVAALPQGPEKSPGFRMYGPHNDSTTYLVDNENVIVHTWPGDASPGNGMYLRDDDGTLVRTNKKEGGPTPGGYGGNIQRRAFDGTLLWNHDVADATRWAHHDIALMPNGNVLAVVWDRQLQADAIAAGRDPAIITGADWMPDSVLEIEPVGATGGNVVWEWHVYDHLIQDFDNTKANFGVVADHPELLDINFPYEDETNGDWNHANSVSYDPVRDLVIFNSHGQDEFYIIDHSTTTAEAAGHTGGNYGKGGDILYRWGNPAAYGHGDANDQQLFNQHGSYIIPEGFPGAGNLLLFNNQAGTLAGEDWSAVFELELPYEPFGFTYSTGVAYGPAGPVWEYTAPTKTDMYSSGLCNAERMPNGNTQIVSGRQAGWMFEVATDGTKVWEYFPPGLPAPGFVFQASYSERTLWATGDSVSTSAGGTVDFDLVSGSKNAGDLYLVMGSLSGTSPGLTSGGFTLPLNFDPYLLFTLNNANSGTLPGTFGTLDGTGNGSAQLVLPPGVAAAATGLTAHHAYAVISVPGLAVTHTSNAVSTELLP